MKLPKLTRKRIYASQGRAVEIAWPKDGPEPRVGHKYTIQSSSRAGEARIIVEATRELAEGFRAMVKLDMDPVRLLGKSGGYTTSGQGAIGVRRAPDAVPMGGPQFRPELEPEAVPADYQRRLSEEAAIGNALSQARSRERQKKMATEVKLATDLGRGKIAKRRREQIERQKRRLDEAA